MLRLLLNHADQYDADADQYDADADDHGNGDAAGVVVGRVLLWTNKKNCAPRTWEKRPIAPVFELQWCVQCYQPRTASSRAATALILFVGPSSVFLVLTRVFVSVECW